MVLPPLKPLATAPEVAREAIGSLERELQSGTDPFYLERVRGELHLLEEGRAEGVFAPSGRAFATAVVLWRRRPLGILELRVLYLEPSLRSSEGWTRLLRDAAASAASWGQIGLCQAPLLGLPPLEQASVFRASGLEPFTRYEMVFPPTATIPDPAPIGAIRLRPSVPEDEPRLARLHQRAYARSLDRFLFLKEADPRKDSDEHLRDLISGKNGGFFAWASHIAENDDRLAGAVLVVDWNGSLIAEVMTDPDFEGRGIATELIRRSLRSLRERGKEPARLNVTGENVRALSLYGRIGFAVSLGPETGWYSRTVLGL